MTEAPLDPTVLISEGFLPGPCFGDESPSNSSMTGMSPRPMSPHEFETSNPNPLLERGFHNSSSANFNENYENYTSPENNCLEPMAMTSPIGLSRTCNPETQNRLRGGNPPERPPFRNDISTQSSNFGLRSLFEGTPDDHHSITPTVGMSLPLIDLEPHGFPLACNTIINPTADVVPEPVLHLPPDFFLSDEDIDNAPSLETSSIAEKLLLDPAHSALLTELDLPSSSPPTSSPPQIFSSSPLASSQASDKSDDSENGGLEKIQNYINAVTCGGSIDHDYHVLPSVMADKVRRNGSPRSPPPDPDINSHIPMSSCQYFPRTELPTHQPPSSIPQETFDHLGDEGLGQAYYAPDHISSQMVLQDPKLLSPVLLNSNVLAQNSSSLMSPTVDNPRAPHLSPGPASILTLDQNIEEQSALTISHTSSQSLSASSSLLSPPLAPLLSFPPLPLPIETSDTQSIPYPVVTRMEHDSQRLVGEIYVPAARSPSPFPLTTEESGIRAAESPWVQISAFESAKSLDTGDLGNPVVDLGKPTQDLNITLGKRKRDDAEIIKPKGVDSPTIPGAKQGSITHAHPLSSVEEDADAEGREPGALTQTSLPNPKRSTIASQKLQRKKLATPFRSPVLKRPKVELTSHPGCSSYVDAHSLPMGSRETGTAAKGEEPHPPVKSTDVKKRHRTQRAASQFKSPLSLDVSSRATSSLARLTPTIQTLERKLQILKRAIKVKHDGDEEALEALVRKWTEAGREVAWEIWELVKDNVSTDDGDWGQPGRDISRRSSEGSWGWEEKRNHNNSFGEERERNWGWDVVPNKKDDSEIESDERYPPLGDERIEQYQDEDEEKKQNTLGTMLAQLGVAPETLGWDEGEGVFVGE